MVVVTGRAQSRNPKLKSGVGATQPPAVEGADAAISALVADECNRVSGQDLSEAAGELHGDLAWGAKVEEFHVWKQFKVR